jgi:large subunit ribosomal protein L1
MEIKNALEELRKEKKRKFTQTVDLIVNLKSFDVRKEALNTFVPVPNANEKKICAFLSKKSKIVDTITELDFEKYKDTNDMKKLAKNYDMFIAIAPMMNKVATKFGRVLGPVGKMPSPQAGIIVKESEELIQEMVEKVGKVVRVRNKEMAIKLPIGKEDMPDQKIEENIRSIITSLEGKLPRGKENIKEVLVKFTMTKPIKIMNTERSGLSQKEVVSKKPLGVLQMEKI